MTDYTLELGAKTDPSFQKLLVGSFVAAVRKVNTTSLTAHSSRLQTLESEDVNMPFVQSGERFIGDSECDMGWCLA